MRSTWPFARGWATEAYLTSMHEFSQKYQKDCEVKLEPRSIMIVWREIKPMYDVGDEIHCSIWWDLDNGFVLDPFGKLVDYYQHMIESSWSYGKGSDHVQTPLGKQPWSRDCNQVVCCDMGLLAKELTARTYSDEVFCVWYSSWPEETRSLSLAD